jgi:hypothetical protein
MTNPDVLKLKTIKGLLESIEDLDDPEDARQAIEMIKAILGSSEK